MDGFEDVDASSRLNGQPQVMVQVFRVGTQSALAIADEVHEYMASTEAWLPNGVTLTVTQDDTRILKGRLELLIRNGFTGFPRGEAGLSVTPAVSALKSAHS